MEPADRADSFMHTQLSGADGRTERTLADYQCALDKIERECNTLGAADINFLVSAGRIQIKVSSLPAGCQELVVSLPDGECVVRRLDGTAFTVQSRIGVDHLADLIDQFLVYLELNEDRYCYFCCL